MIEKYAMLKAGIIVAMAGGTLFFYNKIFPFPTR